MKATRGVAAITVAAALCGGGAIARAQTYVPELDPDRFVLTADPDSVGLTEGARPLAMGDFAAGLAFRLGAPPLEICVQGPDGGCATEGALASTRFGADLVFAYGLGRLGVYAQLPVVLHQGSDFDTMEGSQLSGAGLGDLRLGGLLSLAKLGSAAIGWDLRFSVPTGGADDFTGDGGTVVENRAIVDHRAGRLAVAAHLGYAWRSKGARIANLYVDDELLWSIAGEYEITEDKLSAGLAIYGRVGVMSDPDAGEAMNGPNGEERPAEALASMRYWATEKVAVEGGFGTAVSNGYGAPDYRALVGVRFVNRKPAAPPPVVEPAPPPEPEPEPAAPPPPPADTDGDGVLDVDDACVDDPEDEDSFQDDDGCPEPDNDGDGILDGADGCAMEPEDKDTWQDEDGCPETDNDADGLLDGSDTCPNEPETYNGTNDEDGCPDEAATVTVTSAAVEINEEIYFDLNRARIKRRSHKLLNGVASALTAHADIRVSIQGHTDDRGSEAKNQALSERRAEAVRDYLVSKGIDAARLEVVGFGETQPKVEGKSKKARDKNRRVEFVIIGAVEAAPPPPPEEPSPAPSP